MDFESTTPAPVSAGQSFRWPGSDAQDTLTLWNSCAGAAGGSRLAVRSTTAAAKILMRVTCSPKDSLPARPQLPDVLNGGYNTRSMPAYFYGNVNPKLVLR
jgi:hypothetical protein